MDRRQFLAMLAAASCRTALAAYGDAGGESAGPIAQSQQRSTAGSADSAESAGGMSAASPASSASGASLAMHRDPDLQPFSSASVWNAGIGSGAQWSRPEDSDTLDLRAPSTWINAGEWSMPFYVGAATDPLVTVTCTDTLYPVPPQRIHMPAGAVPAMPVNGDRHMNFFDETRPGLMWSYWGCSGNTETGFTAGLGTVDHVCADLPGDYNFGIGTIRQWELDAGAIHHALRIVLPTSRTRSPGSTWTQGIPWPMSHEDYNGPTEYTGNVIFGSTIGIPASVPLSSLGLTSGGLLLATALQTYGAMLRDTAGADGPLLFFAEPSAEGSVVLAQMRSDLPKIQALLCVLRNQSPGTVNGGGKPIAPTPLPLKPGLC